MAEEPELGHSFDELSDPLPTQEPSPQRASVVLETAPPVEFDTEFVQEDERLIQAREELVEVLSPTESVAPSLPLLAEDTQAATSSLKPQVTGQQPASGSLSLNSGDSLSLSQPDFLSESVVTFVDPQVAASLAEENLDQLETEAGAHQTEQNATILEDLLSTAQESTKEDSSTADGQLTSSIVSDQEGVIHNVSEVEDATREVTSQDFDENNLLISTDHRIEQLTDLILDSLPVQNNELVDDEFGAMMSHTSASDALHIDAPVTTEPIPFTTTPTIAISVSAPAIDSVTKAVPAIAVPGASSPIEPSKLTAEMSPAEERRFVRSLWLLSTQAKDTTDSPITDLSRKTIGRAQLLMPTITGKVGLPPSLIPSSMFLPIPPVDNLSETLTRHFGPNHTIKRALLEEADVELAEDGLVRLMVTNSWRAAGNLAMRLLSSSNAPEDMARRMQIFLCRVSALVKLQLYESASAELEALGDLDRDVFAWPNQPCPAASRQATYVPFSLRLIQADLLHNLGDTTGALDKLYALIVQVRGVLAAIEHDVALNVIQDKQASIQLWKQRESAVLLLITNQLYRLKDFTAALTVMESIVASHPNVLLYQSQLGRLHLQLGNTTAAAYTFQRYEKRLSAFKESGVQIAKEDESRNNVDKGFLAMALGNYSDAVLRFEEAFAADTASIAVINNLSVAHLYLGRLRQAIAVLEEAIRQDPIRGLHETVIFNLCTLYELESETALDKKKNLMIQVAKYYGDHFNPECFKTT